MNDDLINDKALEERLELEREDAASRARAASDILNGTLEECRRLGLTVKVETDDISTFMDTIPRVVVGVEVRLIRSF